MSSDKRKEPRYLLAAEAIVQKKSGELIQALTLNVSGSGLLLTVNDPPPLEIGEEVRCGIRLYAGKAPQSWGMGKVVRLDGGSVAIDFEPDEASAAAPSCAVTF